MKAAAVREKALGEPGLFPGGNIIFDKMRLLCKILQQVKNPPAAQKNNMLIPPGAFSKLRYLPHQIKPVYFFNTCLDIQGVNGLHFG